MKERTPLQEWTRQRWQFKGALTAARALIFYHLTHTEITQMEYNALVRMKNEIVRMLDNYPKSQRITRERVTRRMHAKTREKRHNARTTRQRRKGRQAVL